MKIPGGPAAVRAEPHAGLENRLEATGTQGAGKADGEAAMLEPEDLPLSRT